VACLWPAPVMSEHCLLLGRGVRMAAELAAERRADLLVPVVLVERNCPTLLWLAFLPTNVASMAEEVKRSPIAEFLLLGVRSGST